MNWNDHSKLVGLHAFLGASKYHWINYDAARLAETYASYQAKENGTRLHAFAAECIALGQKLPKSKKTLNAYVNDAIGFRMTPEQVLYYSGNCFGTADSITFKNNLLRIDLGGSGSSGGFLSNIWQWLKGAASAAKSFLGGASKAAAGASGAAKIIPVLGGVGTSAKGAAVGAKTAANALGLAGKAVTTVGTKAAGILGTVGGGIAKVAASLGPHGLLAAAVIAGTVAVGTAVVKNWDKVKEAVGNAWSWIKEKASGLWDGMKSIGGNLMSGLATGVKSTAKFVLKVALSPAYAIISGFKHILGIHSPSKVMAGIGEYVVEGLTRGIVSTEGEAEKGMDEVGGAVIRSALATTNAIADYLSTDNHPSITPVVDLSDASRSSAWLNSAFADRKGTISMAATVTGRMARRADTPSRNQNGYETAPAQTQSNRDVVEAVKTLGERIDRVAESVKGMKVVMNGHKLVGEIKSDINDAVGDIIEKGW